MSDNTELIAEARRTGPIYGKNGTLEAARVFARLVDALEVSDGANQQLRIVNRELEKQMAAAQAIIAEIQAFCASQGAPRPYPIEPFTFDKGVVAALSDVHKILTQSPVDALAAHDRQVAAKAWDEGRAFGELPKMEKRPCVCRSREHHERNPYRSTMKGEGN